MSPDLRNQTGRHRLCMRSANLWKALSVAAGITWWNFYFLLYPIAICGSQVVNSFWRHADLSLQYAGLNNCIRQRRAGITGSVRCDA